MRIIVTADASAAAISCPFCGRVLMLRGWDCVRCHKCDVSIEVHRQPRPGPKEFKRGERSVIDG